jgi:diaminohydroxyphosphoribosylaminopyrimidine deaminase/5-amino-6-(5-phosphoribosylamino)uracil reductase
VNDACLAQALALAQQAIGLSEPNPRVGCVLTAFGTDEVIGQGFTQVRGGSHAEVQALADARSRGHSAAGATAYVTLEPCAHQGRTAPCCDTLIAAGISRVVVATQDPNPLVQGAGLARMRAAGIQVDMGPEAWARDARELNIGFFSRMVRKRPWVRLKVAVSLDGRVALDDGRSQWITSAEARADGHAWRRRAGAVLTGIGTVLADNPRLDVRLVPTQVQPYRVVLDSALRLPEGSRILAAPGRAWILTTSALPAAPPLDADLIQLPSDGDGRVDLKAALQALAEREINELHVEAGPALNAALLQQDLVDELLVYLAPRLLGPGRPLADLPALAGLEAALDFEWHEVVQVGPDLRLRLRPPARANF